MTVRVHADTVCVTVRVCADSEGVCADSEGCV